MCIDFSELRVPISPERKKKNEWGDLKENGDFQTKEIRSDGNKYFTTETDSVLDFFRAARALLLRDHSEKIMGAILQKIAISKMEHMFSR